MSKVKSRSRMKDSTFAIPEERKCHPGRIPRTQRTRTSRPKRHTHRKTASTRRSTQEIPIHQDQREIKATSMLAKERRHRHHVV